MIHIADETNAERIEHKSRKNFFLGTIIGYLAVLAGVAYGLFMTPEIIKSPIIGETQYGLYGLANSVITFFLMDFGLNTAATSYLARLRANGDKEGVERFSAGIFKLYLTLDVLFLIIITGIYFAAPYIFQKYSPEDIKTLQWLFVIIGCLGLINLPCYTFTGVISTYEKFGYLKTVELVQKLLYLAFTILSLQLKWTINGSGIIPIVLINACTALVSVVMRVLYSRYYLNVHFDIRKKITKQEKKEVLSFSAWGFITGLCSRLVITITPFILGVVANPDAVTLFTLISTIEIYIYTFGTIITNFFMAKIARTTHDGTEEEKIKHMQDLGERIGKIQFVIIAMIVFGFASVGQEFVLFWMKGDYKFLILYWCILAISGYEIFHIPQLIFNDALITRGTIKPVAIVAIIKAVVNLGLSFGLSYLFAESKVFSDLWYGSGAVGASIAIAAARIVELIGLNFVYKKYLKISISHYFKSIYIRGFITIAISFGVGLGLHYLELLNSMNSVKLLFNGVVFVIVYTLCTLFITFTKEERQYYLKAVMRIMHIKPRKKKEETPQIEEPSEPLENGEDKKEE